MSGEIVLASGSAEIEVFRGDDGEPRVSAEALALGLGYSRPRDILTTIRRLESEGALLGSVEWATELREQPTGNGGMRTFEVETAYLTQAQALFVTARSKTANAAKITNLVISVFLAAQRGELARPSLGAVDTSKYERLLSDVSQRLGQQKEILDRQEKQIDRLLAHQTRQQNAPKAQPKQLPQSAPPAQAAQRSLSLPQGGQHAAPSPREHYQSRGISFPRLLDRLACIDWDTRDLWWPSEIVIVLREHLGRSYHTDALDRAAWRLGWLDSYGDARIDVPAIVASRSVGAKGRITYRVRSQYVPVLLGEFGRGLR